MAKTVMIVDDISFVRKTLREILVSAHYQVVAEAENGAEAIELYKQHRPDLVTMDIVMPKMSGIEAAKKIVAMDKTAKIIVITAMGQESLIMEAINAGVKDYIVKPFTKDLILNTVAHVLTGSTELTKRASNAI